MRSVQGRIGQTKEQANFGDGSDQVDHAHADIAARRLEPALRVHEELRSGITHERRGVVAVAGADQAARVRQVAGVHTVGSQRDVPEEKFPG
jgi:hypothetical protein